MLSAPLFPHLIPNLLLYPENASRTRMTMPREEIMISMLKVDRNSKKLGISPNSRNTTCHLAAAHPRQALLYVRDV